MPCAAGGAKGNKVDLTMFEKEDIPKVGEMVFF
jgi:hypothetical protein